MKHQVLLVGGPGDGKTVMVDGDQHRYKHVSVPVVVWSPDETMSPMAEQTDQVTIYAPRRRGDYSWYPEGEM